MNGKQEPYKILIVNSGSGYGGSTSYLFYFLSFIEPKRFIPSVAFYFHNESGDIERIKNLGVPVFFIHRRRERTLFPAEGLSRASRSKFLHIARAALKSVLTDFPAAVKLRSLIEREKIDLVVLNNDVHYHVPGVFGAALAGVPCVCRKAGGIGEGRKYKRLLTPFVSLFIAISKATEEDQRMNNPRTRRLETVFEGVDPSLFDVHLRGSAGFRAQFGIPPSGKVIAGIARLDAGKGHDVLIKAARRVVAECPEAFFLIVGDGQEGEALKEQVRVSGLSDRVIFTGWRTDIPALLSITDVFVHCPTTSIEGLGIANLEAMAMGKPTVVSANGGLIDAVVDGVTGYIVPPGDDAETARAITRLLTDDNLARRLGSNARKRVETHFDIRKNVRETERLLAETAARGRK